MEQANRLKAEDTFRIEDLIEQLEEDGTFDKYVSSDEADLELLDDKTVFTEEEKLLYIPKSCLSAGQIINIIRRMFRTMDPVYIDLAEKTAFCSIKLYDYARLKNKVELNIDRNSLIILSVLFTVGAYRRDISANGNSKNTISEIFLYSYLYLKYLTPLKDTAEALLFYSYNWEKVKKLGSPYYDYSSLIFTCMRICIEIRKRKNVYSDEIISEDFIRKCNNLYDPFFLNLFIDANQSNAITKEIENNNYLYLLDEYCNSVQFDYDQTMVLLKFLIYAVDFVSTSTVTHIISTSFLATEISCLQNQSELETDELFTASVLHDLGKVGVPLEILESAGKLSDEQMEKMREHVKIADRICRGIVGNKISDIACRHHETLDGSGYPYGLTAKDLTPQQRIISIADVLSALTDARSYKPSYSKEKTLSILKKMSESNKIDANLYRCVKENYDRIKAHTEARRPILIVNFAQVVLDYMKLEDLKTVPEIYATIHQKKL